MKHILAVGAGIGVLFVLPPSLYAYAHNSPVLPVASVFVMAYIAFITLAVVMIRLVNSR